MNDAGAPQTAQIDTAQSGLAGHILGTHLREERGVVGDGEAAQRANEELQRAVRGHQVVQAAWHARRVARAPCQGNTPQCLANGS